MSLHTTTCFFALPQQDAVVLWEALRPKDTSPEEKADIVNKIMAKVSRKSSMF